MCWQADLVHEPWWTSLFTHLEGKQELSLFEFTHSSKSMQMPVLVGFYALVSRMHAPSPVPLLWMARGRVTGEWNGRKGSEVIVQWWQNLQTSKCFGGLSVTTWLSHGRHQIKMRWIHWMSEWMFCLGSVKLSPKQVTLFKRKDKIKPASFLACLPF